MVTDARIPSDPEPTMGPDARDYERYSAVETESDDLVVYELDLDEAWVQSSAYLALSDHR